MFEVDGSIFPEFTFTEVFESAIIKNIAVLKDLYKRYPLVLSGLCQDSGQMFNVHVDRTSHKGRFIGQGHRSEEHTSELQSPCNLVCRLLLEKKKKELSAYDLPDNNAA